MPRQGLRELRLQHEADMEDGYLAEKSPRQKFHDSMARIVATPVTVVINGVLLCGAVAGCIGLLILQNNLDWSCTTP
jgi:hypothetical protein